MTNNSNHLTEQLKAKLVQLKELNNELAKEINNLELLIGVKEYAKKSPERMKMLCQHKNTVEAEGTDPGVRFCNDCKDYVVEQDWGSYYD